MARQTHHIVQRYEDDLIHLRSLMEQMGGIVEHQLSLILAGMTENDASTALQAAAQDPAVDTLEHKVETSAIRLLALHGPMAADLREIVACITMAGDLERIGDYASSIARRLDQLEQAIPRSTQTTLAELGRLVLDQLCRVMDALEQKNSTAARNIWHNDHIIDRYYDTITRDCLEQMLQHPHATRLYISFLFIAKNLERMGDHITNLAERIFFMVTGTSLPPSRPRGHRTDSDDILPRHPHEAIVQHTSPVQEDRTL